MSEDQELRELELKIKELESKIETLKMANEQHLKQNEVQILIDQILNEKEFALEQEVESKLSKQQLQLIKWSVGTGISVVAVCISIIRIFVM
ncbi:hypothetical protein [Halalkalibacter akibai]|uniref:Uncharacterized protein n=1 Tax=Halalkalibacter akibai (strain ATCC 43226 / DSM 21942 / CIP 109018 / JCM 9157 / 1139) TaxID=1236973 RepID=W4QSI4_HALA3|nr:hypothetical protein [Halalkalibacter akibai]GAE34294.1 hypothetical protein JCM9157_1340 [Halalkalibacter akibai JCM 9157]